MRLSRLSFFCFGELTMAYKLKVRLPDGRIRLCGCGTSSQERYDAIRAWVRSLKAGKVRRLDILEAIVEGRVTLVDAYDHRRTPDAILALVGSRNIEPYVTKWHEEKQLSRKGASSADKYMTQVRALIPEGKPFAGSLLTAQRIRQWLRGLAVSDPTRNRYKAALSSFCDYLVDERALERNPVRDVRGFSEGDGRSEFYTLDQAVAVAARMESEELRAAFSLAVLAGLERQVLSRLVRADLKEGTVWADGGKNSWRRRMARLLFPDRAELHRYVADWAAFHLPGSQLFPNLENEKPMLHAIRDAATAAGLPVLTLHDQRHTFAVNALQAGYKPTAVSQNLGHRDTTLVWQRYGRYVVDERDYQVTAPARQEVGNG